MTSPTAAHAGALLTIDLAAIVANWRLLRARVAPAACAAVVKADAYGLGAARVAPALAAAGCRHFFVAHLAEGMALRPLLPTHCEIFVLHGAPPRAEADCAALGLTPVLNSLEQIAAWSALARARGAPLAAVLQVDTGMARLGLSAPELARLAREPARLEGIALRALMSHLACAEDQGAPINTQQLARFRAARALLPACPASLSNSSGVFLGPDYHFDLARPGAALYGVAPVAGQPNPMQAVVRLQGKVIQVREIDAGTGVGYGLTWRAPQRARIATVAVGYADGYLRSLSARATARVAGTAVALVGRVSMDTITLDVTAVPPGALQPGDLVDLLDTGHGVDALAEAAGTIGYEILTSLGQRYARHYLDSDPSETRQ